MLLDTQKPSTMQRGKEALCYVSNDFAALWLVCGNCCPGHSCHTVAHPLCHPACPRGLVVWLRPRSSQDCTQSRADPGALFAPADLLFGLAHLLARISRGPAPDLAAVARPGP